MSTKKAIQKSYFIKKYNALSGKVSSRKSLEIFKNEVFNNLPLDSNTHLSYIYKALNNLLKANPKEKEFDINIKRPLTIAGLNGSDNIDSIQEIKGLGLPYFKKPIPEKITGLNRSVSSNDIYNLVTQKIIDIIKKSGNKLKWKKGWTSSFIGDYLIAYNFITKNPYRSVNQFLLSFEGLSNPYFLTFKQIQKLKGTIKKGAKGYPIIYYTMLYVHKNSNGKKEFGTYDKNKFITYLNRISKKKITAKSLSFNNLPQGVSILPIIKYYNVFNGADIEGIDFDLKNFELKGKVQKGKRTEDKIFINNIDAENIIKNYPKPVPILRHKGNKAYHQGGLNSLIVMPPKKQFINSNVYYKTLFHEYSHSTGTINRLNREIDNKFGTKKYAFEELVVELSAVFLSNEIGLVGEHYKNSAAYIKGWNKLLIKELEKDNKFIFKASAKAQKSADYILQRNAKDVPLYLRKKKSSKNNPIKKKIVTGLNSKKNNNHLNIDIKPLSKVEKRVYPTHTRIKNNPLYKFLGNLEVKNTGSIVITNDADQGAGKTRNLFQKANMYGENGYKVLFISLEEQPDSRLFSDKVKEYFSKKALDNIYPIGEMNKKRLDELVPLFDFILIDSWNKLLKEILDKDNYRLDIDYDIRKKFNGKVFDMIFQRTTDGKMRGGSNAQFDGDVIIKIKKMPNWKDNYAYYDKNRYMLDNYIWNIYEQKLYKYDEYLERIK